MGTRKVTTPIFRASYVNLLEPKQNQNGGWAYELTMIFEPEQKETPEFQQMLAIFNEAIQEKWKGSPPKTGVLSPFRRGEWKTPEYQLGFDLDKYPEYAGKIIVAARSYTEKVGEGFDRSKQPGLCGPDPRAVFDPYNNPAHKIYSGMYAKAEISMYVPRVGEARVAVGLHNVQKCYDGDVLGVGNTPPENAFDVFIPPSAQGNNTDLLAGV